MKQFAPVMLTLLLTMTARLIDAQQPGVRSVSGGGYTFDANAYKSDMQSRGLNSSSSSSPIYYGGGWKSLREERAERKARKAAAQANWNNHLRLRALDTLQIQTDKTIEFYQLCIKESQAKFDYTNCARLSERVLSLMDLMIEKRLDIEAITTYGVNDTPVPTTITKEQITKITDFNMDLLHSLVELGEYEKAVLFHGLHFSGNNTDTGTTMRNKALADVLMAQITALLNNPVRAFSQLEVARRQYGSAFNFPETLIQAGFVYYFGGRQDKGIETFTSALQKMDTETANLQYAYIRHRLEQHSKAKGENPAGNEALQWLSTLPYAPTFTEFKEKEMATQQEEMAVFLKNVNRFWWLRYDR